MKELGFDPSKSTDDFRKNYKLHDLAEFHGKNLLTQWGIGFKDFGKDKRYQKVWEKGEDRPDIIIEYKGKSALLDWKGKRGDKWLVNERAIKAYKKWSENFNLPVFICFFSLDKNNEVSDRRIAFLGKHDYIQSSEKQWDKNKTVEFNIALPVFNRTNLIGLLNNFTSIK